MASFVTPRVPRAKLLLGAALAATLAFASGCTNTYDTQPAVAYYVAPPPPLTVGVPADGSAAAAPAPEQLAIAQADYADTDPSALQEFHEPLAPYGTWLNDPNYGTIWVPREEVVGADFVPYQTAGHWDYADDYVWVSDYSWGWAPFHYGRWISLPNRGWAWIPGRTYSGAWVTWRTGPAGYGYVGWAPMAPSWYWFDGYAYGASVAFWYSPNYGYCNRDHLFSRNVGRHVVRGRDANVHDAHTSTYTPARPSADGRVAAQPSVNGRVAATPSVNDRTAASPSVDPTSAPGGGGVGSGASFRGPAPSALGIDESRVARISAADSASLAKAQVLATPATAVKVGAQPPTPSATAMKTLAERGAQSNGSVVTRSPEPSVLHAPVAVAPRYYPPQGVAGAANQTVTSGAAVRSQPGSVQTMPAQLPTAVVTAPRFVGVEPRTYSAPTYGAAQAQAPRLSTSSGMAPAEFAARAGQLSAAPSATVRAPTYQSGSSAPARAPAYSAPSSSTFSRSAGSMPSRSSAPTYAPSRSYQAPSRPMQSAPSRSYSAPSRSYSAPSRSVSPSRSYSAPSRSTSSGSRSRPSSSSSTSRGRR